MGFGAAAMMVNADHQAHNNSADNVETPAADNAPAAGSGVVATTLAIPKQSAAAKATTAEQLAHSAKGAVLFVKAAEKLAIAAARDARGVADREKKKTDSSKLAMFGGGKSNGGAAMAGRFSAKLKVKAKEKQDLKARAAKLSSKPSGDDPKSRVREICIYIVFMVVFTYRTMAPVDPTGMNFYHQELLMNRLSSFHDNVEDADSW
jgi:hypothetical protein